MTDYSVYSTPCAICTRAIASIGQLIRTGARLPHHLTIESVSASAQEGCYICIAALEDIKSGGEASNPILAFITKADVNILQNVESVTSFDISKALNGTLELSIYNNTVHVPKYQSFLISPISAEAGSLGRPVNSFEKASTNDDSSWEKVKSWLAECTSTHSSCSAPVVSPSSHPARLLFIDDASPDRVRVVTTSKIDFQVESFIALSHRWQPYIKQCCLTLKNAATYSNPGIEISSLPRTFQDAITVCRRLGIAYLWIDALCIIQDSAADWLSQSMIMDTVYQGAFLTIAAITSTISQTDGLFQEHLKSSTVSCLYQPPPSSPSHPTLTSIFQIHDSSIWVRKIVNSPLSHRAWTLQERLLSRRSLYFTSDQLFWECAQGQYCEAHPTPIPFTNRLHWYPENFNTLAAAWKSTAPSTRWNSPNLARESPQKEAQHYWNQLLSNYSRCALTVSSDKLVAMSGLARKMAPMMDSRYIAGLWTRSLPAGLCWEKLVPGTTPVEYRAPSWTWAASDGNGMGNHWEGPGSVNLVELVETKVLRPADTDEFGPVEGGHILLWGKLAVMEWGWEYEASQRIVYNAWVQIGGSKMFESLFTVVRPDFIGEMGVDGLAFCPITYFEGRVFALVLRRCPEGYRRVGMMWHFNGLDVVEKWLSRTRDVGGFEAYDEETGRCLIRIV